MNATLSPSESTPLAAQAVGPAPEPPVALPRLLLGLALAVALFDLCFWNIADSPGFSFAVFFPALAGIILANRPPGRGSSRRWIILALLAGAAFEAAIETCLTNTLVLFVLIAALAGESYFVNVVSPWGRWLSQGVSLLRRAARSGWLGA